MSTGSLTTPDLDEPDAQTAPTAPARPTADRRDAGSEEQTSEAAEVSSFTSTVPNRRVPARAPNGRFVGPGAPGEETGLMYFGVGRVGGPIRVIERRFGQVSRAAARIEAHRN